MSINNLGKKFNREWIFRNLSYEISANEKVVILGGNGSGKSTLLQVLSGFVSANEGTILYKENNQNIEADKLKNNIAFASPYLQLIEDFTLTELINHVKTYKPFINQISAEHIVEVLELQHAQHKLIKQFSSGMKQRVKLGLAILSDTPLLLLDEPVSNLDKNAINWYKNLISTYSQNRTVIVCSNAIADEYFFCTKELNVMNFKTAKNLI
ncbi:MAG: ABC transporter ATP-binding protein [Bacteroidetes bacterium]|nr:ABC transporter ATP-binding protein [Bacteroidota bacterium]